ncbi:hypothetical protein OIE68_00840 [Nocardia vinacea]|uniref:hypothetical protein n=1 Tax=Nocardia vinacea TaxID=96468 RepID=UPI002E14B6EA|nr:hypothetical protein OIE68_00840 [Nocardia vinacea]
MADEPRQPPSILLDQVKQLDELTLQVPFDATHGSRSSMAERTGMSEIDDWAGLAAVRAETAPERWFQRSEDERIPVSGKYIRPELVRHTGLAAAGARGCTCGQKPELAPARGLALSARSGTRCPHDLVRRLQRSHHPQPHYLLGGRRQPPRVRLAHAPSTSKANKKFRFK